jgi:hypothetical protein
LGGFQQASPNWTTLIKAITGLFERDRRTSATGCKSDLSSMIL